MLPRDHWIDPAIDPATPPVAALAEIRTRVAALVRSVRALDPAWAPPPFDPRVYAEALGVPIVADDRLPIEDALLVRTSRGPTIAVNARVRHAGRILFSVAHELAHLLVRPPDGEEAAAGAALERLCDYAAAELLMPSAAFEPVREALGVRASAVPAIAERFSVSLTAAAIRLVTGLDAPAAVVFFEWRSRPTERGDPLRRPAYRVARAYAGEGFPYLFPTDKSVPPTSAVELASLGRREITAVEEFRLRDRSARLRVSAFPLPDDPAADEPPTVLAVFLAAVNP